MQQRDTGIYASAPLRRLRDAQARVLVPKLQRCVGTHALLLDVAGNQIPPSLPMLGCWARLYLDHGRYEGDLRAMADERLPFVDDAFDLVLLRHTLEVSPAPSHLLHDVIRVLAPGGLLALAGVHPVSGWSPWLGWKTRGKPLNLQWPVRLRQVLRQAGLDVELAQRVGRGWPGQPASDRAGSPWGGGYVLVARKYRHQGTPLRVKTAVSVRAGGQLSPGTRRSVALQNTENA